MDVLFFLFKKVSKIHNYGKMTWREKVVKYESRAWTLVLS